MSCASYAYDKENLTATLLVDWFFVLDIYNKQQHWSCVAEMKLLNLTLTLLTILSFLQTCYGGSFWGDLIVEQFKVGKKRLSRQYCELEQDGNTLRLFKGSLVKLRNCLECTCSDDGLFCRHSWDGNDIMLTHMSGCKEVKDGCHRLQVDARNEFKLCMSGESTFEDDSNHKETKRKWIEIPFSLG